MGELQSINQALHSATLILPFRGMLPLVLGDVPKGGAAEVFQLY
jgi:hypothetical protein